MTTIGFPQETNSCLLCSHPVLCHSIHAPWPVCLLFVALNTKSYFAPLIITTAARGYNNKKNVTMGCNEHLAQMTYLPYNNYYWSDS